MSTQDEAVIEAVARGLCACHFDAPYDDKTPGTQEMLRRWAAVCVARVRRWEAENGYRCVKAEADDGMMMAAVDRPQPDRHDKAHPWGGMYRAVYGAMVSASPPPPGADTLEKK